MQKVKGIKLACLAAFAILPVQAYALGVGKLTMHSALDEPLNATIELTAATATELQSLEVKLGSVGAFKMAGIDRSEQLKSITFSLLKVNGKNIIRLSTEQPFRDPFLHFIINAEWANGSMLREYTALLDPPSYLTGTPASIQAPVVAKVVDVLPPLPTAVDKTKRPSTARPAIDAPISPADADDSKLGPEGIVPSESGTYADLRPGSTYGPVRNGDALWNIAEEVKSGTQLGIAQVMMAIYKQNPDAFMKNNINLIRVGKTLQIPSDSEISSTPRSVAQQELRAQMEEWQEYKDNLTGERRVARTGFGDISADKDAAAEKDSESKAAADDDAEATQKPGRLDEPVRPGEDVLEIVRAKVDAAESSGTSDTGLGSDERAKLVSDITAYQENVGLLEESLASSELEKKELAARVALLEEQIDKANKLIDMQNSDLAALQSKGQGGKVTPVERIEVAEKEQVSPISPDEPVAVSGKLSAPDITPVKPVAPVAQKPKEVKKPPVSEKKAAKTRVRAEPAKEKGMLGSMMDTITSSWITMLGAGLVVLLILVGLFVVFRRRRSIAEFEDSIISGTAVLDISTAESTEPSGTAGGSETSFLSDFVPGMGNMQADEVDPLAEAEVYMAYGRDEQAEEVLKDAASKLPDRHELKLKLLEIYQGRKDISSFETLAEELYPADGNIPVDVWAKVAEMGKIVNPENPLFQGELNVQGETLFGDTARKEGGELGDLLDTGDTGTEETEPEEDTEEITEEIFSDSEDLGDMEELESFELPPEEGTESTDAKAGDFPEPDEAVLDLDLGDFTPDEDQETDSFDLDSLGLNLDDLKEDTEGAEGTEDAEGEIDFNLDGIDLDLGESDTEDTTDAALADTLDMSDLEGIEDINLDLESEDTSAESVSETSEVPLQDETLEFADLGDLTMTGTESDTTAEKTDSAVEESSSEMPAGANETWDEAGTKLDLARAYIEMDDKESAQSILEEVAKEGTDDQKNEARDLINQINAG